EDGIRDRNVTGVQTCALPIFVRKKPLSLLELQLPTTWEKTVELSDALATQSITESNIRVDKLPEIGIEHGGELLPFYRYLCRVQIGRASCRERRVVSGGEVVA